MGKRKVIQQTGEAALKEKDVLDTAVLKATSAKGKKRKLTTARIYISASYNNTVITVTDEEGGVVAWATAGSLGFNGPKKATPFAASKIVAVITEKLKALGVQEIEILARGIGGGRDSAIRSLANHGFTVTSIKDITPVPHNGPRPKKVRRV